MKPVTITVKAFCEAFGVGRTKTYDLIARKELETVRIGARRLIIYSSAEALIARGAAATAAEQAR